MRPCTLLLSFFAIRGTLAARPFLNEPDTGIEDAVGDTAVGTLPNLTDIVGLPDFDWAARRYMNVSTYAYYRNGAAGEWSYRNNLEAFHRLRLRPRVMVDITSIESSLQTTILGYNFSAPFFISPCSRGGYANSEAELGLVKGAYEGNILYVPAHYASLSIEEIAAAKPTNDTQVLFQQVYLDSNDTATKELFQRIEKAGSKAIVFTVDSAADGNRHRAARFGVGSAYVVPRSYTWDYYKKIQNMTSLPVIIKGIMTVEDAQKAAEVGAPAIILSNHGGRQLDGAPSSLEVALEIHEQAPEVFKQIEVYADGGVRYGADVLKLLALGVKAVGLGRPFMYANAYGTEGVKHAIDLLKHEVAIDAANLGVADLKDIDTSYIKLANNNWYS
ncbi:putative2-hydroxy-acid oxidase [Phaeomoniella chlamydospora]|uniref:Putative2-hydroxy-acid oxidase n=1 Tax=Phaeomoniella chlamydospora TaxID=158046 RepID=A0A0G2ERX5_PHACM|nr:putative2-hydroxy-acid oxidase [Phaeomoniella chlamydospora]